MGFYFRVVGVDVPGVNGFVVGVPEVGTQCDSTAGAAVGAQVGVLQQELAASQTELKPKLQTGLAVALVAAVTAGDFPKHRRDNVAHQSLN